MPEVYVMNGWNYGVSDVATPYPAVFGGGLP
jgi:hypothetical protein